MKCDELRAYKGDIYIPVYGSIADAKDVVVDRSADRHNRWREHLPEYCWLCRNFDRCSPGHKCRHQIDIDIQAQWPTKGD